MSTIKLIGGMALFVIAGAPLAWYLWGVLTDILSWEADSTRVLIAIPVLLLFLGLLALLARTVKRWDEIT